MQPSAPMRVPTTVITGFLGAGKTSLVRHLLERAGGRRLALVINEFGDLGIDREILMGCGIAGCREEDVVELANGCICCTVADDFLPTMRRLLDRPDRPDHVVIETSGLALPKPLVKAFAWPEVRTRATVDGVVAVIDAEAVAAGRFAPDPEAVQAQRAADTALDHESPLEELLEEQLGCADMVVLNKRDRLAEAETARVEAMVAGHLRPGVKMLWASHGRLDPAVLLGLGMAVEDDLASRPSHADGEDEHDHDDFESFVVPLAPITDPAALEARIKAAATRFDILRVKGFLEVEGKPMRHVLQAVGTRVERYFDRPWRLGERRTSALVVIGQRGLDQEGVADLLRG